MLRFRQAVLVARDLQATVGELRDALPLGPPYHDPDVAHFGLRNAVMPLGDTFVEVVSPAQEGTAAGRQLERLGGDGGYMVMFQLEDIAAARERVARLGVRIAWEIELDDIADLHLHPSDVPGAIVALDEARPPESWRWAGPEWQPAGDAALTGATLTAVDPEALAQRWAAVLGVAADGARIALDGGELRFEAGERDGIAAFGVRGLERPVSVAGVAFG